MDDAGDGSSPAPCWVAGDDGSLRDPLRSTVGATLSCVFEVNGRLVLDAAGSGTVEINGRELVRDDPDGWRAVDETHIEVTGAACAVVRSGAPVTLRASFPCEAVVLS